MDYAKTRADAQARKQQLTNRAQAIVEEKKQLDHEAEKIKRELIGLDQILDGVEFTTSEIPPDFEPAGFTDKIRKVLSETSVPLVPTQIRDALEAIGSRGSSSRNLLISVHTVLERIKEELEESTTPDGKAAYKRKAPWRRLVSVSALASAPIDPARLPSNIATAIYGVTETAAVGNQSQPKTVGQHMAERGAEGFKPRLGKTVMPKN